MDNNHQAAQADGDEADASSGALIKGNKHTTSSHDAVCYPHSNRLPREQLHGTCARVYGRSCRAAGLKATLTSAALARLPRARLHAGPSHIFIIRRLLDGLQSQLINSMTCAVHKQAAGAVDSRRGA